MPSPYVFLFTNDSGRLTIHMNHSGGPNVMSCEQCMLSSCLTPQYNVYSFVVLKRPPYLMVPVIVTIYWYYNYGLAVLKQLQYLRQSGRIVGLLILGNSALITNYYCYFYYYCYCYCGHDNIDSTSAYCSIFYYYVWNSSNIGFKFRETS